MTPERRNYLVANTPDWLSVSVVAWAATHWLDVAWWVAGGFVALWIVKDLLLYPYLRHYYVSVPAETRIVGEHGVALTPLDPRGFVRVHGEIWQARANGRGNVVQQGTSVVVRDVHGLLLIVEVSTSIRHA